MTRRLLLIAVLVYLSWLAMQAIHELGHVVAAWLTGGAVVRVVIHPLAISRTDVTPNPAPLIVAWGGPIVGAAVPLLMMLVGRCWPSGCRARGYADFFTGFCLIANGAYIGIGSFDRVGDAGDLLRHGSPQWLLVAFGVAAISAGLFIWHRALERSRQQPRVNDPPERTQNDSP
jgi:hypothetical protein